MKKETLRMQVLAGIITEGQYKKGLNESALQENLWDKIKDAPKKWMSKIQGGAPSIMALALVDSGFGVGKYVYFREKDALGRAKIKSVNYNTGDVDMTFELSKDGGKNWVTDDAKGLETVLGFEQELSGLSGKSEEELKTWYDKTVEGGKKEFAKNLVSYDINDFLDNPGLSLAESRYKAKKMLNEDFKVGEIYTASMPTDSAGKKRMDIKVKFLGKSNDGALVVTPIQDVKYQNSESGQENVFEKGKQYNTEAEYLK